MLRAHVGPVESGRALDVATGTGRNAVFLAERGYDVDALDQSAEGLRITRERAEERGVADRLSLVEADAREYDYPTDEYDIVTISFFRTLDRLNDIKAALRPDGLLFYQHHLRSPDATVGPSGDRYRFRANELLHACLDLTVLEYAAMTEVEERENAADGGGERGEDEEWRSATATIVARNSHGGTQSYPVRRRVDRSRKENENGDGDDQ
jgi:SAM-dependent methyltransferase